MTTWIELSREAFNHNIGMIVQLTKASQLGFVVKSNAYGHGLREIVVLAREQSVITTLCVAGITEGLLARHYGWNRDILVMSYYDAPFIDAFEAHLILTIFSHESLKELMSALKLFKTQIKVHIKVDTGMSRLGFMPYEVKEVIEQVRNNPFIKIDGIFSHAGDTNNSDFSFTMHQKYIFDAIIHELYQKHIFIPSRHFTASGIMHMQQHYSFPRIGGALYGLFKSALHKERCIAKQPHFNLRPVLTWYSSFVHITPCIVGIPIGFEQGLPVQAQGMTLMIGEIPACIQQIGASHTLLKIPQSAHVQDNHIIIMGPSISLTDYEKITHSIANELVTHISADIHRVIV